MVESLEPVLQLASKVVIGSILAETSVTEPATALDPVVASEMIRHAGHLEVVHSKGFGCFAYFVSFAEQLTTALVVESTTPIFTAAAIGDFLECAKSYGYDKKFN